MHSHVCFCAPVVTQHGYQRGYSGLPAPASCQAASKGHTLNLLAVRVLQCLEMCFTFIQTRVGTFVPYFDSLVVIICCEIFNLVNLF